MSLPAQLQGVVRHTQLRRQLRTAVQAASEPRAAAAELLARTKAGKLSDEEADSALQWVQGLLGGSLDDAKALLQVNQPSGLDQRVLATCLKFALREEEHVVPAGSALVIVDMQNDFVTGSLALSSCPAQENAKETIPVINALRGLGFDLIVITQDWHPADHVSFFDNASHLKLATDSPTPALMGSVKLADGLDQIMWPKHCVQESWGAALVDGLELLPSDARIYKGTDSKLDSYSAFFDNGRVASTPLHEVLQQAGIQHTYICGLAYDVCVKFTALHSAELQYDTYFIADACRGVSTEGMDDTRRELTDAGVKIIQSSDLIP